MEDCSALTAKLCFALKRCRLLSHAFSIGSPLYACALNGFTKSLSNLNRRRSSRCPHSLRSNEIFNMTVNFLNVVYNFKFVLLFLQFFNYIGSGITDPGNYFIFFNV